MKPSNSGAIKSIEKWLNTHKASTHTYRSYEREFKRLQVWLLDRGLTFKNVMSSDISEYFLQFAKGELSAKENNGELDTPPSTSSLQHAKSVLHGLFDWLQSAKLRKDNPVRQIRISAITASIEEQTESTNLAPLKWLSLRKVWIDRLITDLKPRDPLARTLVIADFAFWLAMRRSELASALMSDFHQDKNKWQLAVLRFGKDEFELVDIPDPAMETLRLYRTSRGLPADPSGKETNIPLISRLRTEHAVNPWTVRHSLKILTGPESIESDISHSIISVRNLRQDLILEGLSVQFPAQDLTRHVRSQYAVTKCLQNIETSSLASKLSKLESIIYSAGNSHI